MSVPTTRAPKEHPPYFSVDGDIMVPTPVARGPWGDTVSGHAIGGLLGRAVALASEDPDFLPARLTVDLLKPAQMSPMQVRTSVVRSGRRITIIDAQAFQDDSVVSRATSVFLRTGSTPEGQVWTPATTTPPLPTGTWARRQPAFELWCYGAPSGPGGDETEWRQTDHRKFAWIKEIRNLVDGEPLTPFVRAALAGDVTSAVTHWGTDGLRYINADFTLTLSRLPDGDHIGLGSDGHHSSAGIASGAATLFDHLGPIGHSVCTALGQPGGSFRPAGSP